MPLHMHAPIHRNPHVTLLIFVVGINFCRKAAIRNLFSKRKASSKCPKINSLRKLPTIWYSLQMFRFVSSSHDQLQHWFTGAPFKAGVYVHYTSDYKISLLELRIKLVRTFIA